MFSLVDSEHHLVCRSVAVDVHTDREVKHLMTPWKILDFPQISKQIYGYLISSKIIFGVNHPESKDVCHVDQS